MPCRRQMIDGGLHTGAKLDFRGDGDRVMAATQSGRYLFFAFMYISSAATWPDSVGADADAAVAIAVAPTLSFMAEANISMLLSVRRSSTSRKVLVAE